MANSSNAGRKGKKRGAESAADDKGKKSKPLDADTARKIKMLRAHQKALDTPPSLFEITQVAAALAQNEGQNKDNGATANRALELWDSCKHRLWMKLHQAIKKLEDRSNEYAEAHPWEVAIFTENFPLEFDRSLRIIVGATLRRADRYGAFRKFLGTSYCRPSPPGAVDDRSERATRKFEELKAAGFSDTEFEQIARAFQTWRTQQAQTRAREAARKRWKQNAA